MIEHSSAPALADNVDTNYVTGRLVYDGQPAPYGDYVDLYFPSPTGEESFSVARVIGNNGVFSYGLRRYIPGMHLVEIARAINESINLRSNILPVEFSARYPNQLY